MKVRVRKVQINQQKIMPLLPGRKKMEQTLPSEEDEFNPDALE